VSAVEPHRLAATAAAARIQTGELTAETLLRDCLARIEAREPVVGAWQYLDPDAAIVRARECDRAPPRGLLHGLPLGVKDVIATADMPTGYGSPIHEGHRPRADAACVARARAAGAVIAGKTVTTEFAALKPGRTTNPHDASRTPGGSSSGSAAAVADYMVPLALGTQTVGSTIRPAAYCGVVGFKPTYGTIGLAGVMAQAPSLDTLGLIARCVNDVALLRAALLGARQVPAASSFESAPSFALCRTPHWPQAEAGAVTALGRATDALSAAGAPIREVELPEEFERALDAHMSILKYEFRQALAFELLQHAEGVSVELREFLAEECTVDGFVEAQRTAQACRAAVARVFDDVDFILTPSADGEAPPLGAQTKLVFQRLWTVLHLPCITLPAGTGANGLPVAVQLVGAYGADARLLSGARWVEQRLG